MLDRLPTRTIHETPLLGVPSRTAHALVVSLCLAAMLTAVGCRQDLNTTYGRQRAGKGYGSVNGTDVLANMFGDAGHTVVFRRVLVDRRMELADTVVWVPNDQNAPNEEVCTWFSNWLSARPGRTLIYVGRDFDATPLYWEKTTKMVPAQDQTDYGKMGQWSQRISNLQQIKPKADDDECEWFTIEANPWRKVAKLEGPWADGVDSTKTELELTKTLKPAGEAEKLLTSADDVMVNRIPITTLRNPGSPGSTSQIITVANGSFLLNLPLVNHENRKLAGRLIETVGPPGRVVFLQSGVGGPSINPSADESFWHLFGAWPLNVILLHLAVLGVIFCFARWPIFGRPKMPPAESISDFGKHVAAVGDLLRRTKDRTHALSKLPEAPESPPARQGPL